MGAITSYIKEAMRLAEYEIIEDEEPYYGHIPGLEGVWAAGKTLEACRDELESVLEDWILLGLRFGDQIPVLAGIDLNVSRKPLEVY
ncbi:MAG: type II toxin-antitoxin system HicB family antitoxin [Meiothermus sp.]